MDDIGKTPLMSREEEKSIITKAQHGDMKARNALILANMRLVVAVALKYKTKSLQPEDLISIGALGLIRAIIEFDNTRGLRLISYAVWWIRAAINQDLNDVDNLIKLPSNNAYIIRKALLEVDLGFAVPKKVVAMIEARDRIFYLDNNGPEELSDLGHKPKPRDLEYKGLEDTIVQKMGRAQFNKEIKGRIEKLPPKQKKALSLYYGIGYDHTYTVREVGEILGCCRQNVHQLMRQGLTGLRRKLPKSYYLEKLQSMTVSE